MGKAENSDGVEAEQEKWPKGKKKRRKIKEEETKKEGKLGI